MKYAIPALIATLILWFSMNTANAFPIEATFTLTFPTEREDGTAMSATEVQGFQFECLRNGAPSYSAFFPTEGQVLETFESSGWDDNSGDYECVARTVDTDGRISDDSNVAALRITGKPGAPVNFNFDGGRL